MSRHELHTLTFDSLSAAADFAEKTPRYSEHNTSSGKLPRRDWDGGMSLDACIQAAKTGYVWQEGLNALQSGMEVTDELAAKAMRPVVRNHLVGGQVNVPRYLMGHPKHMRRRDPAPKVDLPVLAIGIPLGIYWGVDFTERMNYAAAIMSVVDEFERVGYRCEITVLWRAGDNNSRYVPQKDGDPDSQSWVNIEYTIKGASERWNASMFAFCIGHSAFQRRLTWRIAETQPQWYDAIAGGYCDNTNSAKLNQSMAEDFDIFFPLMESSTARDCRTPEGAFKLVQGIVTNSMERIREDMNRGGH